MEKENDNKKEMLKNTEMSDSHILFERANCDY